MACRKALYDTMRSRQTTIPSSVQWNYGGNSTTFHIKKRLADLLTAYELGSPIEHVEKFLRAYGHLVPFLLTAKEQICKKFPKGIISLTVEVESNNVANYEAFIRVSPGIPFKEAREILKQFDEEWWFANLDKGDGRITLVVR